VTERALALIVVGLIIATPLSAQEGLVLDHTTKVGLAFAEIYWRPNRPTAEPMMALETKLNGQFTVPSQWSAPGWVEIRSFGYQSIMISFAEAEARQWHFELPADPLRLESILVTPGSRNQQRSQVAVPIAEVTTQEISISGAASADQLIDELPGIQSIPKHPVGSTPQIRGIGGSRVLVLIDGQPSKGALLENRDLSRISLSGIERVEVVKGPLSTLYGSDALGGVINLITRTPETGFETEARILSGSEGRYEGDVTVSGGGPILMRAHGSWRQQEQVPGLDNSADAFTRVWDFRSTVRTRTTQKTRARADISYIRERQRWPIGGGFSGFNDNRGLTAWAEVTGPNPKSGWTARILTQKYEHLFRRSRGDVPIADNDKQKQLENLWKASIRISEKLADHQIDLGIEGSSRSINSPDKILESRAADDQLELFGQDAWTLGSTTITGGIRATYNNLWGHALSPTLGFTTVSDSKLQVRAIVGRGFRAPSFKELAWDFANLAAGYIVQGSPNLEPESSWNVTAGIDWAPSQRIKIGFEAYRNQIANLIETTFVGNNASGLMVFSPGNISKAQTQGFEISASGIIGTWETIAGYVLLNAKSIDENLPLDRRAEHSGRIRIGRTFPVIDGLQFYVTTLFTGASPIVGINDLGQSDVLDTQESLVSVNFHISLGIPRGLSLVFGGSNLLDMRPEGWQSGIERRFRIGIETRDLF